MKRKEKIQQLKTEGKKILRAQFSPGRLGKADGWKLVCATPSGGWAVLPAYKGWKWDNQKDVEGIIDALIQADPNYWAKEPEDE